MRTREKGARRSRKRQKNALLSTLLYLHVLFELLIYACDGIVEKDGLQKAQFSIDSIDKLLFVHLRVQ